MELLLEYTLEPGDEGYSERPGVFTPLTGRVYFDPNPEFDGRRVIVVASKEKHEALLHNGNIGIRRDGKTTIVVPADLVGTQERRRLRKVVVGVLQDYGLVSELLPQDDPSMAALVDAITEASTAADEESFNATAAAVEMAEEYGVSLEEVDGTGKDGKITVDDVRRFIES